GTIRKAFLVFSPKKQTLSLFNDEPVYVRLFDKLVISPDCRAFGVVNDSPEAQSSSETTPSEIGFFFSADTSGLKEATTPESTADWKLAHVFGDDDSTADGDGDFSHAGCIAPKSDSMSSGPQPGPTGLFHPIGLGAFWEPEARWKVVRENV